MRWKNLFGALVVSLVVLGAGLFIGSVGDRAVREMIARDSLGIPSFLAQIASSLGQKSVPQNPLTYRYGVSVGDSLFSLSPDQINQRLDTVAGLGTGWLRFDLAWDDIQPTSTRSYNWSPMDAIVSAARAHNFRLLPIIAYTPAWARPASCPSTDKCTPADPAAFAAFAAQAVKRYSGQGVYAWEIWNEPNIKVFWQPVPDATAYAALLKATYASIKAQDPSAIVVSGGLSPAETDGAGNIAPIDFLTRLYAQGAKASFDALGFHPYSYPAPPSAYYSWSAWSQMQATNQSLRSVMTANGDSGKAIWLTEFGAPTNGPGPLATASNLNLANNPDHVTEDLQATIMADATSAVTGFSWAGPLFWYTDVDQGTYTNTIENFFGLIRYDGTTKPAYDALRNLLIPITNATSTPVVPVPPAATTTPPATTTPTQNPFGVSKNGVRHQIINPFRRFSR
jgi:hypothetical protein